MKSLLQELQFSHQPDGTEVALTSTDFQVSTFNSSTAGVKTLTVSYLTFSRTFTVTVNPAVDPEATVIDIIITPPTKLIYQLSETINTAGLIVKKNMSDSTQLTLASSEYTITGFETLTAGTKTITITYGEFSKTFTITVETGNIQIGIGTSIKLRLMVKGWMLLLKWG